MSPVSPVLPGSGPAPHRVRLVDGTDELRDVVVAGLQAAEATGAVARATLPEVMVQELAPRFPAVGFSVAELVFTRREPERIAGVKRLIDSAAPRPVQVFAHVTAEHERDWDERCRCEAVTNLVYAGLPLSLCCLYDVRTTPAAVLEAAVAAHPQVQQGDELRVNPAFTEPRAFLRARPLPEEPLQRTEPLLTIDSAESLPALRHALGQALRGRVGNVDVEEDFHLALSEVAANAFRHGVRPVGARLWASADRLIGTISDAGSSFADPAAGYQPAHGDDLALGGMGLWLARKLCDHVDLIAGRSGLTVRLVSRLG